MMRSLTFLIVVLVKFSNASQLWKWQEISELVPNEEIEKSPYDYGKYRAVVLKNGLKAFLASDSNITFGYANLKIMSGQNDDPEELPQIMNLLMKYTQNKTLNKFNDSLLSFLDFYQYRFLQSYTSEEMTSFQIRLNSSEDMVQSLERMSDAVKLTTFNSTLVNSLATKMHNHDREPPKGGQGINEYIRYKIFMPGSSPPMLGRLFSSESLLDSARRFNMDLADVLAELQKRQYLADKMYLLVVSNHSLDDLTQLVVDKFGSLPRSYHISKNWRLDRPKKRRETPNQIHQTGFGIKTGSDAPMAMLELQFMNRLGVTIPKHIIDFMDYCVYEATGPLYLFPDFLRNQSLLSWFASPGQVQPDIDVFGFSMWPSNLGIQNLDLVLNHTFRHINAAKLCLANSSKYSEYATDKWNMINDKSLWDEKDEGPRGFSYYFPFVKDVRKLLLSGYQVPKTIDFAEATDKYFPLIDAKNMIYVLSDKNVKEKLDQTDPLTGLKYSVKKLDENFLNMMNELEPATSETYAGIQLRSGDFFGHIEE